MIFFLSKYLELSYSYRKILFSTPGFIQMDNQDEQNIELLDNISTELFTEIISLNDDL